VKIEDMLAQYSATMNREDAMTRQSAAEAAQLKRQQSQADATLAHERAISAEAAKQEAIGANRAPAAPTAAAVKAGERAQIQQILQPGGAPGATGKPTPEQIAAIAAIDPAHANFLANQQKAARDLVTETTEAEAAKRMATDEAEFALETTQRLLANRGGMASAVGTVDTMFPTFGEDAANFERDLESLGSLLTLGNLKRMTGVLSESDIKLLRDAATGNLDLSQGEGRLYDVLTRIEGHLSGGLGQEAQYGGTSYQSPTFSEQYNPWHKTESGIEYTVK
jgi:hypothetical protein